MTMSPKLTLLLRTGCNVPRDGVVLGAGENAGKSGDCAVGNFYYQDYLPKVMENGDDRTEREDDAGALLAGIALSCT